MVFKEKRKPRRSRSFTRRYTEEEREEKNEKAGNCHYMRPFNSPFFSQRRGNKTEEEHHTEAQGHRIIAMPSVDFTPP